MKILIATSAYASQVRGLFEGHEAEILPRSLSKMREISGDILVFTGGEDVYPEYYGGTAPKRGWFNVERDEIEMGILRNKRVGLLKVKKVLGICRGHQLLNVAFGGSLVYDIPTEYGEGHPAIHPIEWEDTPLAEIYPEVNSMHHQGFSLNASRIGDAYPWKILGYEPQTKIIEAMVWADTYLGVQFHPEFMLGHENTGKFVKLLEDWVNEKVSLLPTAKPRTKIPERGKISGNYSDLLKSYKKFYEETTEKEGE